MVRSCSKRFCGSKVDSEFAEKNGLRDWKLASCLLKNLCFTGRLFILCDARILRRPAIQWESASTLSAAKSSCRSGWRWGINRMIMSRNSMPCILNILSKLIILVLSLSFFLYNSHYLSALFIISALPPFIKTKGRREEKKLFPPPL